jgi:hypothetical protein
VPSEPAEAAPQPESGEGAPAPAAEMAPPDIGLLPANEAQQRAEEIGKPAAAPPQQALTEVSLSEAVLNQAFADDYFSSTNFASEAPPREETEGGREPGEEPAREAVAPAQTLSTAPVPGPQEDPDDLFESPPAPPSSSAPAAEATAPVDAPAEPRVPPPPMRAIPRPPGSDPLAAVRDLSEEELTALFS